MQHRLLNTLFFAASLLALTVIILGAYTRLTDAGLGCPDWPGCYGQIIAPDTTSAISEANANFPLMPVDVKKARTEMTHRYFAESLGLLIVVLAFLAYRKRQAHPLPLWLPATLVFLVIFQGLLGMWTVTMRLFPLAVMGHLLGGFCTLSLLWLGWLHLVVKNKLPALNLSRPLLFWCHLLLIVVFLQILLGGWTSANYAALICPDFPMCQGLWLPPLNIPHAFNFLGGIDSEHPLSFMDTTARTTIHLFHRFGALITLLCSCVFAFYLWSERKKIQEKTAKKWLCWALIGFITLLAVQISLGLSNVFFSLPLKVAVAHNAIAALLLLFLITLYCCLSWTRRAYGK